MPVERTTSIRKTRDRRSVTVGDLRALVHEADRDGTPDSAYVRGRTVVSLDMNPDGPYLRQLSIEEPRRPRAQ